MSKNQKVCSCYGNKMVITDKEKVEPEIVYIEQTKKKKQKYHNTCGKGKR
jgi:hypothetical protein